MLPNIFSQMLLKCFIHPCFTDEMGLYADYVLNTELMCLNHICFFMFVPPSLDVFENKAKELHIPVL